MAFQHGLKGAHFEIDNTAGTMTDISGNIDTTDLNRLIETVVFRLKLPEPVLVQLKACARARGVAPTLLVRELLDRYIDDLEEDGITT